MTRSNSPGRSGRPRAAQASSRPVFQSTRVPKTSKEMRSGLWAFGFGLSASITARLRGAARHHLGGPFCKTLQKASVLMLRSLGLKGHFVAVLDAVLGLLH